MRCRDLILYEDPHFVVMVPFAPKGRYHLRIHLRNRHWLADLKPKDLSAMAWICHTAIGRYLESGIQNLNITLVGSPLGHIWGPVVLDLIPRVNIPAAYEQIGTNVVDVTPEDTMAMFRHGNKHNEKWNTIITRLWPFSPATASANCLKNREGRKLGVGRGLSGGMAKPRVFRWLPASF